MFPQPRRPTPAGTTDALRMARSAAVIPVSEIAAAAGVAPGALIAALGALPPRGVCAEAATRRAAATHIAARHREAALGHRAAPPPVLRLAALNMELRVGSIGSGSASWAARTRGRDAVRRQIVDDALSADLTKRHHSVGNVACPPAILRHLAADPDTDVRRVAATRTSSPADLVAWLSTDTDVTVRAAAAANPNTAVVCLRQLVQASRHYVRTGVATNPATPPALLEEIVADARNSRRGPRPDSAADTSEQSTHRPRAQL